MQRLNSLKSIWNSESGVALMLVLFVVSLLIIIAAEFAFTTRMEIDNARFFKEDIEGYYYAQAGFQYALTEIIGNFDETYLGPDGQVGFYRKWMHEDDDSNKQNTGSDSEVQNWPPLPIRTGILIGTGKFDYLITDEEGRINLNYIETRVQSGGKSMRDVFRELLVATGVPEGEEPDVIVDSILDWIDRNDEHRLNGAESDWYEHNYSEMGFSYPYSCKNQPLDTIDELLMIRGMKPEILYGSDSIYATESPEEEGQYQGILPYITVYGYHRKINEGSAAPLLLSILDPENAEDRLNDRQNRNSEGKKQVSRTFRIEVRGYSDGADVDHVLMAVVRRSQRRNTGGGAEIYYWNDNAMDFGSDLSYFENFDSGR